MVRRITLTLASLAIFASATSSVDARNLFNRQADPAQSFEALPAPGQPAQRVRPAPKRVMPYQAAQKMPYHVAQKGVYQKEAYQKGSVATCVRYVQHRPHRKTCCDCGPSYETFLTVIDPKTCCAIDVPVCLPACCAGYPQSSGRDGLFGRGITKFSWHCGYSVRIVVGHRGDVTVHYYGV
ncbi:MAG: hypothetical protein WD070_09075 [Pirellulaceae bacterium]